MQQYFYTGSLENLSIISLSPDDNHHLVRVMRARLDDQVQIVDSQGVPYLGQVMEINNNLAKLSIQLNSQALDTELPIRVTVACGLSKNDKLDWIVQKIVECGAHRFIPLALERDVVKWDHNKANKRIERLQKIAKEAAEQSHRLMIPEITPLMTLQELTKQVSAQHQLVAYEEVAKEGRKSQFKEILSRIQPQEELIMVFGSEGGLESSEIALLASENYVECSLGPRVLRAETAPIYALSAISYQLEL